MGCNPERPCPTGQTCCDGACIDPLANVVHCGACGARCSVANATAACRNGRCAVGQCTAPRTATATTTPANGCETDTQRTVSHCGACGTVCTAPANATATCVGGTCGFTCAEGFADCDGNAANGCEVDLRSDVAHCGACATACPSGQRRAHLRGGRVRRRPAPTGFADCDGNPANGCEVDTAHERAHCGACGNACAARPTPPACAAGAACSPASTGFGDCDGTAANGCEADLARAPRTAGPAAARAPAQRRRRLRGGRCTLARCDTGFADCDGSVANGCERPRTTPRTAARCGNAC
jgi:hypothetical protein